MSDCKSRWAVHMVGTGGKKGKTDTVQLHFSFKLFFKSH